MTDQTTRSTNILFSTTRQWNPGDEFILKGIQNLLQESDFNFNGLIFNRHPDNLQSYSKSNPLRKIDFDFRGKGLINSFIRLGSADNSFKSGMTANGINLVIVAGSPGWYGKYTSPLYDLVGRNKIPIAFMGIGSHHIDPQSMQSFLSRFGFYDTLRSAQLITVRDTTTEHALEEFGVFRLPCPALFFSTVERQISKVNRIALIYSTDRSLTNHKIPAAAFERMVAAYQTIIKNYSDRYEIELVAHYIDEFSDYYERKLFDNPIRYSYDSADYLRIYGEFDLVIGPRVHGIGAAASLGIPGIHLGHDHRSDTVHGFKAETLNLANLTPPQIIERLEKVIAETADRNEQLREWKSINKQKYLELIKNRLLLP